MPQGDSCRETDPPSPAVSTETLERLETRQSNGDADAAEIANDSSVFCSPDRSAREAHLQHGGTGDDTSPGGTIFR